MSTKHAMIPLIALLPLGLVACDETVGEAEGTDASTAGGADAGRTDGGGLFGGGSGGGGGGGGLFGDRGGSDDNAGDSDAGSSTSDGGGSVGEDAGGGGDDRPDITPGPNVSQAEEIVDTLLEEYCELAAPCYGYTVQDCLDYYGAETDYLVDVFSNAPLDCLDALETYSACGLAAQECIDGELVEDETACESSYTAFEEACGDFFGEIYGEYYDDDYYGYGEGETPFPDEDSDSSFECTDGSFIPMEWVCDEEDDCEDGSDEEGC